MVRKFMMVVLIFAVSIFLVVGCGGGNDNPNPAPDPTPTPIPVAGVNIFPNGDFEGDLLVIPPGATENREGWHSDSFNGAPGVSLERIELGGWDGHVLKLGVGGPCPSGTLFWQQIAQYENLSLKAGKKYTVKFKISASLTTATFYVKLYKPDSSWNNILPGGQGGGVMQDGHQFTVTNSPQNLTIDWGGWTSDQNYSGVSLVFSFGGNTFDPDGGWDAFIDNIELIEE